KRAYCLKTQPATGETYPKSDLFNKAAYCLKIQPATGSFARNLIYSTKPSLPFMGMSHVAYEYITNIGVC
ncbi:hypothetical protein RAG55_26175, partial [Klebsiella pneumoniae]